MFCPACGVKNEGAPLKCFVCGKVLPQDRPESVNENRPRRPTSPAPAQPAFASVGDRMLALLFDRVLLAALLTIPVAAFANRIDLDWRDLVAATALAVTLIIFAYHLLFEALFGATLGKAIFGIRVRGNGAHGAFSTAAIRNGLRLVDGLPLYGLGFLTALFSPRHQRIGDHMAHALVVEQRLHWAARAGWIVLWLITIAAAIFYAGYLRPDLTPF